MVSIKEEIPRLRNDFVHGSSWYYESVAKLLATARTSDLRYLYESLWDIRPGMGSLTNIRKAMEGRRVITKEDANRLGLDLLKYLEDAKKRMRGEAEKIHLRSALSISYSSAVKLLLEGGGVERMFLLRSLPGKEYRKAVSEYSKYCDLTVIPDSSTYAFAKDVEAVVIGFDGLYSTGFFTNKIGTAPLCLSARTRGIEVIATGESFKATDVHPEVTWTKVVVDNLSQKIPLFDLMPVSFIDKLITDLGTIRGPKKQAIEKLNSHFLETIVKN